jgi:hypothetical protein
MEYDSPAVHQIWIGEIRLDVPVRYQYMIAVCLQSETVIPVAIIIMSRGRDRAETEDQQTADLSYRATSSCHD